MDSILDQLHALATQGDDAGRHKVLDAIRNLQLRLETPHDTLSRFSGMHLEITAARVGADLGIFKILVANDQPLSTSALAAETGAAPAVLSRILRYLASVGMIQEAGQGAFTASSTTKTLSQPGYEGGVRHFFDNIGPCLQAFPGFLADTKYQDVTNSSNTAFQKAFNTSETAFQWLPKYPERFGPLQQVMTVQGAAGVPWFDVFPFEKELAGSTAPCAFVDVGGGFGHQCHVLSSRFPGLLGGKIILQDLKETIVNIPPVFEGFEKMEHNFFTPQPVKGARFYYLRNILHDWPDDKCVEILKNLISAFGPESQILIDEMVLPNSGVPWEATTIDLTIMASLGARERTSAEWNALLGAAGLKALRIDTYMARRQDSIIQAVPIHARS
ncbi:S-adenosyl-L-methionine-dependent methyltransferase [Nemania sp. NC0429]|nr:S-adenosyl-L-methionine-dependent methyltransferase [Nemania sp. NC0429]